MPKVHAATIVGKNVHIGKHTRIGPYSILEDGVEVGENCRIDSCVRICTGVRMGDNNQLLHGAVIGGPPQNLDFDVAIKSGVMIGKNNIFREHSTVNRSMFENRDTVIGNNNFLMATGHIAHDCMMKDRNVICNGALLAGHVSIGNSSFISGNVGIHQSCNIGDFVMVGGCAKIVQDCPHYSLVVGAEVGRVVGTNGVGLRRADFSLEDRKAIKRAFRTIFWSHLPLSTIKARLREDSNEHVQRLSDFLEKSTRGICSGQKRKAEILGQPKA